MRIKQTNLMYKANLCHQQIKLHIDPLVVNGLLNRSLKGIVITEKGLERYTRLRIGGILKREKFV